MKFSIVTISLNQACFLRRCIDSVLSQDYDDLEYIVVDPGSTDGSRAIIESYGNRLVRVFEPDQGPADGLNNGFRKANGDVFAFLNADDYLLPGALRMVQNHYNCYGLNHIVSGCGYVETSEGSRFQVVPTQMTISGLLFNACTIFQQATFLPSNIFRLVGGFNPENRTCWDMELFLKLLLLDAEHRVIKNDLAVFTIHHDSITGSGRLQEAYFRDRERIFKQATGRPWGMLDTVRSLSLRSLKKLRKAVS